MEMIPQRYVWRNAKQFAKSQLWHLAWGVRDSFAVSDLLACNPRRKYHLKEVLAERSGCNPSLRDADYFVGAIDDMLFPVAIVAHPFGNKFDVHRSWAASVGLRATLLPCSWNNPAGIGVLYTRPDTEIDQREWGE